MPGRPVGRPGISHAELLYATGTTSSSRALSNAVPVTPDETVSLRCCLKESPTSKVVLTDVSTDVVTNAPVRFVPRWLGDADVVVNDRLSKPDSVVLVNAHNTGSVSFRCHGIPSKSK